MDGGIYCFHINIFFTMHFCIWFTEPTNIKPGISSPPSSHSQDWRKHPSSFLRIPLGQCTFSHLTGHLVPAINQIKTVLYRVQINMKTAKCLRVFFLKTLESVPNWIYYLILFNLIGYDFQLWNILFLMLLLFYQWICENNYELKS